jgi:hypothetical protein
MARPNYNLIRFIRRCIRQMKKEYGGPVTLYKLNSATTDRATGAKTVNRDSLYIARAVVLPDKLTREKVQTISIISANKQVVQGGTYDPGTRRFIIDRTDAPGWDLQQDDWLVYNSHRYDIKYIEEFEQRTAWLVAARKVDGSKVNEDIPVKPAQNMILTDTATGSIA